MGGGEYLARTLFVAVTAPRTLPPPACVLRLAGLARPLALKGDTSGVTLAELGDGGLVEVLGLAPGATVVIFSAASPPTDFSIGPKTGCPAQYNYFGGGLPP